MADVYVSSSGSGTAPYDTWAKAATTLATGIGALAAGDTLHIDSTQSESFSTAQTLAFPGTLASPNIVLSQTFNTTTYASGASFTNSVAGGAIAFAITGSFSMYGVSFTRTGSSYFKYCSSSADQDQFYHDCTFSITTAGATGRVIYVGIGANYNQSVTLVNPTLNFSADTQGFSLYGCSLEIIGGQFSSGSTAQAGGLIYYNGGNQARCAQAVIDGLDFSNAGSTTNLFNATNHKGGGVRSIVRNVVLPASWTGGLVTGTVGAGWSFQLVRAGISGSGVIDYPFWQEDYAGTVTVDTGNYLSGGQSDGSGWSYKMVSNANAMYPTLSLELEPQSLAFQSTTGSAKTATVEIAQASGSSSLTNADICLNIGVMHDTGGSPLNTWYSTAPATPLTSSSTITSSSATWTGLTTPVKQKITQAVTPEVAGPITAYVSLYKASTTVYVNILAPLT